MNEKSEVNYHQLEGLKSSHGFPSTPTSSRVILLHSLANGSEGEEGFFQEFSSCKLEVVGQRIKQEVGAKEVVLPTDKCCTQ